MPVTNPENNMKRRRTDNSNSSSNKKSKIDDTKSQDSTHLSQSEADSQDELTLDLNEGLPHSKRSRNKPQFYQSGSENTETEQSGTSKISYTQSINKHLQHGTSSGKINNSINANNSSASSKFKLLHVYPEDKLTCSKRSTTYGGPRINPEFNKTLYKMILFIQQDNSQDFFTLTQVLQYFNFYQKEDILEALKSLAWLAIIGNKDKYNPADLRGKLYIFDYTYFLKSDYDSISLDENTMICYRHHDLDDFKLTVNPEVELKMANGSLTMESRLQLAQLRDQKVADGTPSLHLVQRLAGSPEDEVEDDLLLDSNQTSHETSPMKINPLMPSLASLQARQNLSSNNSIRSLEETSELGNVFDGFFL